MLMSWYLQDFFALAQVHTPERWVHNDAGQGGKQLHSMAAAHTELSSHSNLQRQQLSLPVLYALR
jgi:hypothetical protein